MSKTLDLGGVLKRIDGYITLRKLGLDKADGAHLKEGAQALMERAFMLGEIPRSDVQALTGLGESSARRVVQQLKAEGFLTETSSRSPLRFAVPAKAENYYFPELA